MGRPQLFKNFKQEYKEQIKLLIDELPIKNKDKRPFNNLENKLLALFNYIVNYNGVDVYNSERYFKLYVEAEELFEQCYATNYIPRICPTKDDLEKNLIWKQYCLLKKVKDTDDMLYFLLNSYLFNFHYKTKIKKI